MSNTPNDSGYRVTKHCRCPSVHDDRFLNRSVERASHSNHGVLRNVHQMIAASAGQHNSQNSLLKLPDEILLNIANQLDLSESSSVAALTILSLTCKHFHHIVQDATRLKNCFKTYLHYPCKILPDFPWESLRDAAAYARYAFHCDYLVRNVVGFMVRTCPEAFTIPLAGWDNLFSVGLLVRAKLMGFNNDNAVATYFELDARNVLNLKYRLFQGPRCIFLTDKLTTVERLTLVYSTVLWQQAYAHLTQPTCLQRREMLEDAGSGQIWLWSLASAFVMEGPLFLLRMWYGWHPKHQDVGFLDQGMMMKMAVASFKEWCRKRRHEGPTFVYPVAEVFNRAYEDIHSWREKLSINKPAAFTKLGLGKEAAQSLLSCLDVWCALEWYELPWYYDE